MDALAAQSPSAWFSLLELAIRGGDPATAAEARDRLGALGVDVQFRTPSAVVAMLSAQVPAAADSAESESK